jgi:hypothetical protein
VRNHTSATLQAEAALAAFLQTGGTTADAELLLDQEGRLRLLRAQRTTGVGGEEWAAVRNPRDGRTAALICSRPAGAHVQRTDWGTLGAHLGVTASLRLGPQEEQSFLAFLALARDEAEARAYRVLSGCRGLP